MNEEFRVFSSMLDMTSPEPCFLFHSEPWLVNLNDAAGKLQESAVQGKNSAPTRIDF